MNEQERQEILYNAKHFFRDVIAVNHVRNTDKLRTLSEFNVNPFLVKYLANFLTGNDSPQSIAKALVYPRVLGTSINTSFGQNLQYFCSNILRGFGSTTSGIDIEFIDCLDGRRKYCQIKAGPNTINRDDVDTVFNHFRGVRNLARTNGVAISIDDLIVGVLYGTEDELSGHYRKINEDYPVIIGQEFWHRLTGDENFYFDLIEALGEVAIEIDGSELLQDVIDELADEISKSGAF